MKKLLTKIVTNEALYEAVMEAINRIREEKYNVIGKIVFYVNYVPYVIVRELVRKHPSPEEEKVRRELRTKFDEIMARRRGAEKGRKVDYC